MTSIKDYSIELTEIKQAIENADAVLIGAGAGLSTAAGFTYSGERFERYFFDFAEKYGIRDIYSGGFYPFLDEETRWAWWARHIYFNRHINAPKNTYKNLLALVKDKEYFVITTNVDHQFQKAGFDKKRLFYTQGDYGLFQSTNPKIKKTFDNEEWVEKAMVAQGFIRDENGEFTVPKDKKLAMRIPTEMIPRCPITNGAVTMNLRSDDTFVEDDGWHDANKRYVEFLGEFADKKIVFLELGVGSNTPVIIKYPFWRMTYSNKNATYVCINYGEAVCPEEIKKQSICIDADIDEGLKNIK
ncbi:MAG: hypothetical protein IJQ66_04600 [Clostridia bacterium]|nr:hypothetical protein [Clostridia bacterium]